MSVVLNPIFQIACLADIKTVTFAVEHAVDARLHWHRPQSFSDDGDTGTNPPCQRLYRAEIVNPRSLRRFRGLR
jgi:hypothetical protein